MIEREGDRLAALHLRTGSYANGPALAHAVPGNLRPDFPPINKTFELCYACVDADVVLLLHLHLHWPRPTAGARSGGPRGSLALRHVDAGSCTGCEHELTAAATRSTTSSSTASTWPLPPGADVLLVTGAITCGWHRLQGDASAPPGRSARRLRDRLQRARKPRGSRLLDSLLPVDLRIPGGPPTAGRHRRGLGRRPMMPTGERQLQLGSNSGGSSCGPRRTHAPSRTFDRSSSRGCPGPGGRALETS
jgi:hypothetical protein